MAGLSQHRHVGASTSFPLSHDFGTLAGGLGCFPLRRTLAPAVCVSVITFSGIRSLHRVGSRDGPLAETVLYPGRSEFTSATLRFRGEPAISRFDWPFTDHGENR